MLAYASWFMLAAVLGRPSLPTLPTTPDTTAIDTTPVAAATAQPPQADNRDFTVKVGDYVPEDLELHLADGRTTSLRALRGQVVVLEFTASWCGVCRQEMPHLEQELWQTFKGKGVTLIGVDLDEPLETVKAFAKGMHITYPLALDPGGKIFGKFAKQGAGVTRNVVIDPTGKIIYLTRLYDPAEFASMIAVIRQQAVTHKP